MLDISSVIRNPEISRLSPVLLAALSDPSSKTKDALEELLQTEFLFSLDAASLALLVPILGDPPSSLIISPPTTLSNPSPTISISLPCFLSYYTELSPSSSPFTPFLSLYTLFSPSQ